MSHSQQNIDPIAKFLLDNQVLVSTFIKGLIDIGGEWFKEHVDLFFTNLELQNKAYRTSISRYYT